MSDSAATAKEVAALAATYRERQQTLAKAKSELASYLVGNPQAKAIEKYQSDYRAFLESGNIMQGHPTFPLEASTDQEINPAAKALEQWKRDAYSLNSTRKDIVKAVGNAEAGKVILADIEANKPLADISATVKKHTPLFEITNAPTKEEAIAAVYAVRRAEWEKAGKKGEEPALKTFQNIYQNSPSSTAILIDFATRGRTTSLPTQDGVQLSKTTIAGDAINEPALLGAALLQVEKAREKATGSEMKRPEAVLIGADGKRYTLEAKELSAYLQTAKQDKGVLESVDSWAKDKGVALNNHGKEYGNGVLGGLFGGETVYVETPAGKSRIVANGIITEPLQGGHYGSIKGLKVGDKDDLDIYVSDKIMKDIQAGKKYEGKIFVMQQMSGGKTDELKVGFTESLDEFRKIQASTWKPTPDFGTRNEGAYMELNYEQWKQLKADIAKKPDLTLEQFVDAHKDMKIAVTKKKDLPHLREVDGPTNAEIAGKDTAMKTLQANLVSSTDGIGTAETRAAAKTAQAGLAEAAKKAHIAGKFGATEADAAKAVDVFTADITAKAKAYNAAWNSLTNAVTEAAKNGKDFDPKELRATAIRLRPLAIGAELETPAATAALADKDIDAAKKYGQQQREAALNAIVVAEHTIKPGKDLRKDVRTQAADAVAQIKQAMIAAGLKETNDVDAAFVTAAMAASENRLPDLNAPPKGELRFAFSKREIDSAIVKVAKFGVSHIADLDKLGGLDPSHIVGEMTREQKQR